MQQSVPGDLTEVTGLFDQRPRPERDYDADGWTDLFVTGFGGTALYRNTGDGAFEDVTSSAGVYVDRWTTAAAFGDIDRDGYLDLYVTRYCAWTFDEHHRCHESGYEVYCGPEEFDGDTDVLFLNRGDGTFEDATQRAGIATLAGKSLGVLILDHDTDGDTDIYVANDGTPNLLFSNICYYLIYFRHHCLSLSVFAVSANPVTKITT